MDDFSQPKIVYPNMTKYLPFVYDDKQHLTNQKCFIITGENVAFLTSWALKSIKADDNDKITLVQPTIIQEEEIKPRGRRASQEKSLIEYLKCDNAEGVIDVIRDFVITHNTSYGLALPYYALSELNLFTELINAKEYSIGLAREFSDIEGLKSESSCRQAIKWLKDEKHVERDGKMQMLPLIESDEYQRQLQTLKSKISAVTN